MDSVMKGLMGAMPPPSPRQNIWARTAPVGLVTGIHVVCFLCAIAFVLCFVIKMGSIVLVRDWHLILACTVKSPSSTP